MEYALKGAMQPNHFPVVQGRSLIYFGAGIDFKPIVKKDYETFSKFIFIDALTKLPHYGVGQSGYTYTHCEEVFVDRIKEKLANYGATFENRIGDMLTFNLNRERTLEYHINTTVEEALANPDLAEKIRNAKTIHVKGFHPFSHGLNMADVPNLYANLAEMRSSIAAEQHL